MSAGLSLLGLDPLNLVARGVLAFGGLVVLPLGLRAVAAAAPLEGDSGLPGRLSRAAREVAWVAGAGLAAAQLLPAGWQAACLALPWALLTALVGVEGLRRLRAAAAVSPLRLELACLGAGFAALTVSGAFGLTFRAGGSLLGYSGTQCLLTANHFTFAGFGASVLAGLVGLRLRELRPLGVDYRIAAGGTSLAVPLVALGIFASRKVEVLSAWALAACISLLGLLLLQLARAAPSWPTRALFALSGVSAVTGAAFAVHFALRGFAELDGASFQRMLLFHGLVNAVGFVGAGLLALSLVDREA